MTLENLATDNAQLTWMRREKRTDHVIEIPFNENHVEYTCPECEEEFEVTVACMSPSEFSPTFDSCSNWECDAFLKYRHDGPEEPERSSEPTQAGLTDFTGGTA